jgi:hypothetical protein
LNDNGGTGAHPHTSDVDGDRSASFLRPGFAHFGAPWREEFIRKIRDRRAKRQTAPLKVNARVNAPGSPE